MRDRRFELRIIRKVVLRNSASLQGARRDKAPGDPYSGLPAALQNGASMSGLQIIGRLERKRAAARSTGLVGRASRPQSTRLRAALYLRELRDKQLENPRKKRDNELL